MPICCAPGCDSGYDHHTNNVSFHRFPSDVEKSAKWVRRIHRENFTPTTHSRVCSKHFAASDYIDQRSDSNSSRNRGKLQRRRLKPDAYPTIFPNLPSYLTTSSNVERSTKSLASNRMKNLTHGYRIILLGHAQSDPLEQRFGRLR